MLNSIIRLAIIVGLYFALPVSSGCQPINYENPPGYSLDKPKTFWLNESLHEISGICFVGKNKDTIYAIEDETGKLFYFHPGDKEYQHWRFGRKGDFEDVTVLKEKDFIVLRSDGSLFRFPISQISSAKEEGVQVMEHILPEGEYEGIFADTDGKIYAMCKNCPNDKHKSVTIYVLQEDPSGKLNISTQFTIKVSKEQLTSINDKVRFHPSAISRHPLTRDWYILSSVNKSLLVFDSQWQIKGYYPIRPADFRQPEGICFDPQGNLYISNEGAEGLANIQFFAYHSK